MSEPNLNPEPVSPADARLDRRRALLPGYLCLAIIAVGTQTASVRDIARSQQPSVPPYLARADGYGDPLLLPRPLAEAHLPSPDKLLLGSPPFDDRLPEDRPLSTLLPKPETPQSPPTEEAPTTPPPGSGYIGPTFGFNWNAQPLPAVVPGAPAPSQPPKPAPAPRPVSPHSSELPNEQIVALSRLANPQLEVRGGDARPIEITAEKPLGLRLSLGRPEQGYAAGDTITAQVQATSPCYPALIRVDASGKPMLAFQSPRPTRQFTCTLKAGPNPGHEYLLAVASAHPLSGADLSDLLKAGGNRFSSAARTADSGDQAASAWNTALDYLGGLLGPQRKLQRHEWAFSATSFITRAATPATAQAEPAKPAGKPKPKAAVPTKPGAALSPSTPNADPAASVLPKPEAAPSTGAEPKPQPPVNSDESALPE